MNKTDIKKLVNKCISVLKERHYIIQENRLVTFGKKVYPNNGWCIFLGGGSGSGKGQTLKNQLPINGKVINVDHWKDYYAKMHNMDYDSHNPEQVNAVHQAISQRNWKGKVKDNLFNPKTHQNKSNLPNIIFDMTAKHPYDDIFDTAEEAQELGYKTMLVWVVATRSESILRNLHRDRRVPDKILHDTYNSLMREMPKFLQSMYATECLDDAWIVFSSYTDISRSDLQGNETHTAAVQLKPTSNGFFIDKNTMERLTHYLGKEEATPDNPSTFLSSDEVAAKYGTKNQEGGYDFDRSKLNPKQGFYRQ